MTLMTIGGGDNVVAEVGDGRWSMLMANFDGASG